MAAERMTVSFDAGVARRVRQCGSKVPGGQSAYLAKLVRADELRESGLAHARWFQANPDYLFDAEAEREASASAE